MTAGARVIDGTRFAVEGSGSPIVLIHGVGLDLGMWEPVARALASQHQVIRYDMLGHGGSAKPAGPYRLADFVAQLQRLADALDLVQFDVVGFSMGGLVAQGFAVAHPERVHGLVLLNTVYQRSAEERAAIAARVKDVRNGGFAPSVETALDRWFTPAFRAAHPDTIEDVRRRMLGNDLEAYANAYAVFATADEELVDAVAEIACSTLVMTGAEDQRSTMHMAEALASRIPLGRSAILAGQRHMTPLEVPERLASTIAEFVRGNAPAIKRGVAAR
jgi:3-oxoadipate enol-lactonase